MKVAQNQQTKTKPTNKDKTKKTQFTSSEMDKEEEKSCINDFLDKMNIFLTKSLKKHILKLGWNRIILHDVQIGCQQLTVLISPI